MRAHAWVCCVLAVLVGVLWLCFSPGQTGPWLLDDWRNIVNSPTLQPDSLHTRSWWKSATVNAEGEFNRPVSRLSFAHTVSTCGLTPQCFKAVNILLHAFNALLTYLLSLQLLKLVRTKIRLNNRHEPWIATAVAAAWALHPIHVSTVLYAVQRMTILSTLFSACPESRNRLSG
jgi:hypothetical protein